MTGDTDIHERRASYSKSRLTELGNRLGALTEVTDFPGLTIFSAGSYARLEASEYSDIDMFFLTSGKKGDVAEPRTKRLRLFGKVVDIVDEMGFPKFSNDCEYLVVLHTEDILENLGGRVDDHENYFTARMLLLLESHCLFGSDAFDSVTAEIVSSYFKDYPDHKQTFQPTFLLNDVCRFWKTLLLNYENKRALRAPAEDLEIRKTRQKVRNFKLKYSRMTTCFASIAALGSHRAPVTEKQVIEMTRMTPRERLTSIPYRVPKAATQVSDVLERYSWFLEMTGLPTVELEAHFSDKQKRTEMFQQATAYGDAMYALIRAIDEADNKFKLLRTLVI